jgi:O-antigen ligase
LTLSVNNPKAGQIAAKDLNSTFPVRGVYITVPAKKIPLPVRWSFLLFVFTLPFQAADLGFMTGFLSVSRIFGLLFFASYLFYYNGLLFPERSFPHLPGAMWWFGGYVAVFAMSGFFVPEQFSEEFRSFLRSLVQLIILFWCAFGLLQVEKFAKSFLLTYSLASVILAVGMLLGVPGFSVAEIAGERVTALGDNPNALATVMALAAVMIVGLSLNEGLRGKIFLLSLTLPLLIAMVTTGSRGGVAAFMIGCLVYLVPFWQSKRRWAALLLSSLCLVTLVVVAVKNPVFFERAQQTYYEGSLAGREQIFPAAVEMMLEKPILGWHPIELWYELGSRIGGKFVDVHNLFLHILLEVGLVGGVPFFIGLWCCGWAAWKARFGNFGFLPLALFSSLLVVNLSGTDLYSKQLWIVLALAVAAESTVMMKSRKRFAVLPKTLPSRQVA